MVNPQDKTHKSKKIVYATFTVESPKLFSVKKTAMYGVFALLSIFMINVPTMLENASAYATDNDEILQTYEHSLDRNHFGPGSPVHPNLVLAYDQGGFTALDERTKMKIHFSYGPFESNSSEELTNTVLRHGRA